MRWFDAAWARSAVRPGEMRAAAALGLAQLQEVFVYRLSGPPLDGASRTVSRPLSGRKRLWFVMALGVLNLVIVVGTLAVINRASGQYFGLVRPGWGIWVTMLGCAATIVTSIRIPRAG